MEQIILIDADKIPEDDKATIQKIASEYIPKIQRVFKDKIMVKLHYKKHGERKYDLRVVINCPDKKLEAQESDWNLRRTLHKVFENIEREMEHKFKLSDQNKPFER
ncbi:MAG TPA: hypothetical protein VFF28_00045 [Candidatus Nanoarchaeia archaeon]|nr:hypothetical protein [Candidatus Nanoarchaeia archaeon]